MSDDPSNEIGPALEELANLLDTFELRLPFPGAEEREETRATAVHDIRDHLLPRLADRDAPLVAAFFGPTGVGKSVVVNGLAQERVASPGPVRPSTVRPVVWAHRDHAARYWREFLRQVRERIGPAVETIVGDDPLTRSLTLVDTPPLDHRSHDGALVARDVLAITDLCVFVTSALRYADAASWEFLELVQRRGVPLLLVLNRLPGDARYREEIVADYAGRLEEAGLLLAPDPALIFAIPEQATDSVHGGVPPSAVAGLRNELEELTDRDLRSRLARQATRGAVLDLAQRVEPLGDALAEDRAKAAELAAAADRTYGAARKGLTERVAGGELAADDPAEAAAHLVTHLAGTAAQETAGAWEADDVGRALLDRAEGTLWRHAPETHDEAAHAFASWVNRIAESAVEAVPGRARARRRRRVAVAVQVAVLAGSNAAATGLTGVYGSAERASDAVQEAREALVSELAAVLERDARRFASIIGNHADPPAASDTLPTAVERVTIAAKGLE